MSNATELLRRALDELIAQDDKISAEFCCTEIWDSPPIIEEIRAYLDAEPEADPVAWIKKNGFRFIADIEPDDEKETPLYLYPPKPEPSRKPMTGDEEYEAFNSASKYAAWLETENRMLREARKPLTDEEVDAAYDDCIDLEGYYLFEAGVRFAEKHHKIGEEQ